MKTFSDLEFKPHPNSAPLHQYGDLGIQSRIFFDNGFGASVVKGPHTYGGKDGLYELAVLDEDGHLCYTTQITNDVEGYLTEEDVTKLLIQIQNL